MQRVTSREFVTSPRSLRRHYVFLLAPTAFAENVRVIDNWSLTPSPGYFSANNEPRYSLYADRSLTVSIFYHRTICLTGDVLKNRMDICRRISGAENLRECNSFIGFIVGKVPNQPNLNYSVLEALFMLHPMIWYDL